MTDELPLALQPRPFQEVRDVMIDRARRLSNPCRYTKADEVEAVVARLTSTDPAAWAAAWSAQAEPYEAAAAEAEAAGDVAAARENYLVAYDYHHIGRFPTINHPSKVASYQRAIDNFLKASRYDEVPLERIEIPFEGRAGEGSVIPVYFRRPDVPGKIPIVVSMGGIDGFKEEREVDGFLRRGIAALTLDLVGVGECPIRFGVDSERLYDYVFDWLRARGDLDMDRMGLVGNSFGGYWAAKLAHTHRDQLRAVVAHGGPMHYMFTEEALHVKHAWYAFELYETTWYAMGIGGLDEWREKREALDMMNLGIVGTPSTELLCVNGASDVSAPPSDSLIFPQNEPTASAWFFPGGHMGRGDVRHRIVDWMAGKLTA